MPDQDTKPTTIEAEQPQKTIWQTLTWLIPIVIAVVVVVIIALALLGPSMGTVYSSIGPSI